MLGKMKEKLLAFFSPEIRIQYINKHFIAADQVSMKCLCDTWGTDKFPPDQYDEVLSVVSQKGYSLCVLGEFPD